MTGRLNCQVSQFVCVLDFLEICERRNLFTQNAGIVNQTYLSKRQGFGVDISGIKLGTALLVSREYYKEAVSRELMNCVARIALHMRFTAARR